MVQDVQDAFAKHREGIPDESAPAAFARGLAGSMAEIPATIGGVVHRIGGNLIGDSDPITEAFKQLASEPRDSLSSKAGALFETMAEWMVGEGELKALTQGERMTKLAPVVKMLEKYPKLSEAALAHPEVVRLLPDALRQAITGTVQTAAHGGSASESLESGALAGSLGLALPMAGRALFGKAANAAEAIQPTVRDLDGAKFTQLASELRGPNGEMLNPKALDAANIAREWGVQAERQGAFKQLQTNLAQKGIGNALNDANAAASSSGVAPAIQRTAEGWRYIPPDGSTSMSADETRATMNQLKQLWLDKEWSPAQEGQIRDAYNDMARQLQRHDTLNASPLAAGAQGPAGPNAAFQVGAQPFEPHHVDSLVNATSSYGDAASHLRDIANRQLGQISPELRQQYLNLNSERNALQDDFDAARNDANKRDLIMQRMDETNQRMEELFKAPGTFGLEDSPAAVASPLKMMRQANAFQKLQNVMDQHFNLRADVAEDINRPRVATRLNSLADHMEQVKQQYGDVLNPLLGDQGLNHITELGDLLKVSKGKMAAKSLLGNATEALKDHLNGVRSIAGAGGMGLALAHFLGSNVAGAAGGLGVLGAEGAFRMVRNRIATDPAFATKLIEALRTSQAPEVAGKVLAALGVQTLRGQQQQEEEPDAASQ